MQITAETSFANDHFTTTVMGNNHQVDSFKMKVSKKRAPDKNADSEPGIWGSAQDFPPEQTFTTSSNVMNSVNKFGMKRPVGSKISNSEMKLGYPQAEAKNPWKTIAMQQYKDPLLGARKKGATAVPQPIYPAPNDWQDTITGSTQDRKANLFERYQTHQTPAHRASSDHNYHVRMNPAAKKTNLMTGYGVPAQTTYKHTVQAFSRPTLSTLGAIRP